MTTLDDLISTLIEYPDEALHLNRVVDWLQDNDRWTWPTVLGLLRTAVKSPKVNPQGLYALAATWYDMAGDPARAELIWKNLLVDDSEHNRHLIANGWTMAWSPVEYRHQRNWQHGFLWDIRPMWDQWLRTARAVCDNNPVNSVTLTTYPNYVVTQRSSSWSNRTYFRYVYTLLGVDMDLRAEVSDFTYRTNGPERDVSIIRSLIRKAWPEPHHINLPQVSDDEMARHRFTAAEVKEPTTDIENGLRVWTGGESRLYRVESNDDAGYQLRPRCDGGWCDQPVALEPCRYVRGRLWWLIHRGRCGGCGRTYYAVGKWPTPIARDELLTPGLHDLV